MAQTLFRIPNEFAGLPVFGIGWLLAAWTVFSIVLVAVLVRRHGWDRETQSYLPVLVLVGAVIVLVLPRLSDDAGLPIRGYGLMLLAAVVSAVALTAWRGRRVGFDPEMVFTLAFWAFIPGIVGARLFYVIEYWPSYYVPGDLGETLGRVLNVAQGGLVVYGSIFGGLVGLLACIARYRLPALATLDLIAPSLLLGIAIGRMGCFFNGCCFGGVCDLPWAVRFPAGSPAQVHQVEYGLGYVHGLRVPSLPAARFGGESAPPRIAAVEPGSAAERAGLKPGEVIQAINGRPVASAKQAQWQLVGADRPELLLRGGSPVEPFVRWTLEQSPHLHDDSAADRLAFFGVTFVATKGAGPVVAAVRSGSAAEREGVAAGQQLLAVSGKPVGSLAEARRLLELHERAPWLIVDTDRSAAPAEWAIETPLGGSLAVHPTQLYSVIDGLVLCSFLLAYAPFRRRDGEVTALALTLLPITRFMLEIIRTDEPAVFGTGLSISQNVSVLVLAAAVALWAWVLTRPAGTAFLKYEAKPAG
jgi:phosphatidylglycerol:prolipoprotein diacylglycerol transferase